MLHGVGRASSCAPRGRTYTTSPSRLGVFRQLHGWFSVASGHAAEPVPPSWQASTFWVWFIAHPSSPASAFRQISHLVAGTQWPGGAGSRYWAVVSDAEVQGGADGGDVVREQGGLQRQHAMLDVDAPARLRTRAREARVLSLTGGGGGHSRSQVSTKRGVIQAA